MLHDALLPFRVQSNISFKNSWLNKPVIDVLGKVFEWGGQRRGGDRNILGIGPY